MGVRGRVVGLTGVVGALAAFLAARGVFPGAAEAERGAEAQSAGPSAPAEARGPEPGTVGPAAGEVSHLEAYAAEKRRIDAERQALRDRLERSRPGGARKAVIEAARAFLPGAVERLTAHWMGTPWEFYGATETPRKGSIACGYFVSTVLRDAGFRLERVRLAQQPAGWIIETFLREKASIHRYSNLSSGEFAGKLERLSDGLYIVGLDVHVGFILKRGGESVFIHSSYYDPPLAVVRQPILERSPLTDSRFRMIGNLVAEDRVIERWLKGEAFPTFTR